MQPDNILDAGNFLRNNLTDSDREELIILRDTEKKYQRAVNGGRNAIFFMVASYLLSFTSIFLQFGQIIHNYYYITYLVCIIGLYVFLALKTTSRPNLYLTIALLLIIASSIIQTLLIGASSRFAFTFIIIFFIGRGLVNARGLVYVREKLISFGEQPTF